MVANAQKKWTVEEYLAFEDQSEERHEYIDGIIFPVGYPQKSIAVGSGRRHSLIISNLVTSLASQLTNTTIDAYAINMRVKINSTQFVYPDVTAIYNEPQFTNGEFDTLLNPTVIIEVLSPSTEDYDRGTKFKHYMSIDSLQEYILIAQDEVRIDHYTRQSEGDWHISVSKNAESIVTLPSINCTLLLSDIYRKVTFEASTPKED